MIGGNVSYSSLRSASAASSNSNLTLTSNSNSSISTPIERINHSNPIELGKFSVSDDDSVLSVEFSHKGVLMASISMSGQVKIWQVVPHAEQPNWPLLRILRDSGEENVDEFFTGAFLPNGHFVVAGKRKHRHKWDAGKEEPQSLPGLLKIFDLRTGQGINRLSHGHIDEILYLKPVRTRRNGNFIISCGLDGRICRWAFSEDWESFAGVQFAKLGSLAFHFDQICDELVAVAVDNGLIIYDILELKVKKVVCIYVCTCVYFLSCMISVLLLSLSL